MRDIRSVILRYALALGSFLLILGISFGLPKVVPFRIDLTALIIIAMIASAWYLGLGPGLLLAIALELTLDYFSHPPVAFKSAVIVFNRMVLFTSVVWFASSRRKAQERLQEQSESLRVTLASIGDAVIATNNHGLITFVNPMAEKITGWTMAAAVEKRIDEVFNVISEATRQRAESTFVTIKRSGNTVGLANHTILLTKDNREVPIENSGAPIKDPKGNTIGLIIVFHDVTERRRAELEREQLLTREQAARADAEASDRLKDEFLATVSHELRTPLNAILGWAATLNLGAGRNVTDGDRQLLRRGLGIIQRNAKAQGEIISDILDVSRIITGKLRLELEPVEFAASLRAAIETLCPTIDAKSIKLSVAIQDEHGLVAGDPDRLQQIIWNLISNAIKFTPEGGRIDVRLERVNSHLELSVKDSGIGISPGFLPHAFERFRQADSSTTRAHGGLGLGLAIVRHLVELHGGHVAAESDGPDLGSTFKVRLPLATATVVQTSRQLRVKVGPSVPASETTEIVEDLTGLRVLVVDDEPDTLEILCIMLNQSGADVRAAASSAEALETFSKWRPNVLISDIGMPGEDGFTLINRIRSLTPEQGGNIPAAALTAHAREEDRVKVLAAGIAKPVDSITLSSALAGLAARRYDMNEFPGLDHTSNPA